MKIPYLIIVCTVLLVSGAINVGSTDIIGKSGEKTSMTDLREGIGWQINDETTHRQVRLHRTVKHDAAHQAAKNSHTSIEFDDKGRPVQLPRLHVSRVQVTILSLCLLWLKPVGHA
ncbi:MAG: hypothetical protein H0X47_06850 [Nitrospirales bacterium]|nr:hypothetical protein [Nitrospirales bacterium]